MTSDRLFEEHMGAMLSPSDLKQIKDAVRDLRTTSPTSALADLVEDKIRALENEYPVHCLGFSPDQARRITS
jgi:hypothetical protein